jgi:hypothetical protein
MTIFISAAIFGGNIYNQVKKMIDNEIAIILQSFFSHKYIEIVTSKID